MHIQSLCVYFRHLFHFFLIKIALRLNINYPSTIDVSPVILSQTCASLCRTIIVITSSGSDNDNVYLWLWCVFKSVLCYSYFYSRQIYYNSVILLSLRISIIPVCPEAPCHENCKMSSPNVFSVGVCFFSPACFLANDLELCSHWRLQMNSHEASVILEVQRSQFDLARNKEGKHLPHLTAAQTGQFEGKQRWPDITILSQTWTATS